MPDILFNAVAVFLPAVILLGLGMRQAARAWPDGPASRGMPDEEPMWAPRRRG